MSNIYNIPNWNKVKFEKYLKSLTRKGLDVKVENLGETIENIDNIDYLCTTYSVENETLYEVNGWQFIGTIEHKENGNIIRKAVSINVPERYYTAPNECEHCHTIRNRIDTYLVMGPNGDFKQVGKSCLKAYTGLNPANCALIMSLEAELAKMEIDREEVILGGYNTYGSYRGYDSDRIKKLAYAEIKANGYKKATEESYYGKLIPSTRDIVLDWYNCDKANLASDEDIAEVDNWVGFLDISHNDYFRNASTAYISKYYEPRDLNLVISLIAYYFKDKAIKSEKAAKEEARKKQANQSQEVGYLGQVKDKVEFEVATDSILFVNDPYTYYGNYTYTHKIIDTNGHIILWTTSQGNPFEAGSIIKATIKAQKEFRGELQTVVTRGKVQEMHQAGTFDLNTVNI